MSSATLPVEIIPGPSRTTFRDRAKTVRVPAGIAIRVHPGIAFAFSPESDGSPSLLHRLEHPVTRPVRHNGIAYSGINILMLWASAIEQGFAAPIWMTFKQAIDLNAHVRKGEKGSLVVYANSITKTEDDGSGNEVEREIPFMKGYTVFNVEQIDGLWECIA